MWAYVAGKVWESRYTGHQMPDGLEYEWRNTGYDSAAEYFGEEVAGKWNVKLQKGDRLYISAEGEKKISLCVLKSSFVFGR